MDFHTESSNIRDCPICKASVLQTIETDARYLSLKGWTSDLKFVLDQNSGKLYEIRQNGNTADIFINEEGQKLLIADNETETITSLQPLQFRNLKILIPIT